MAGNYIAIDLGATSGRVILATNADGKIKMETVHRFPTPLIHVSGKYCWDIYAIYADIIKGLAEIGKREIKVESIGIDTWGVDFACIAKDGSIIGLPRSYRDPYTNGIPERFFKKMPREELYERTGIQIMNFNSVFQLYALDREKSFALSRAKHILFMPDALSYMLTGKMVCEYTILSTSALMNPDTKKIDKRILEICHVRRRRFPKVVMPGTKIGRLSEDIAAETGLDRIPVVAVGGHDTASAVAAVPALDEHFAYLSSGTWSLMGIESPAPMVNETMAALNFTNEGGVHGEARVLKNITGMWLLEQCLARWREEGRIYDYAQVAEMAGSCPASANLLDPDAPEFASPTDMPAAIERYCISRGFDAPDTDAKTIRLIYDSLAAKYAEVFHKLQELAPFTIDTLHIIGGGSQNDLLNRMTADACGVRVVAGPAECTALGNVMIQAGLSRRQLAASIETKEYIPHTL